MPLKNTRQKKQRLRKKADDLWKGIILARHDYRCELCPGTWELTAHHLYFKSSYPHMRFDLDNGISLCGNCHGYLHRTDREKMEKAIEKVRGKEWRERLKRRADNRPNGTFETLEYYEAMVEFLTKVNQ